MNGIRMAATLLAATLTAVVGGCTRSPTPPPDPVVTSIPVPPQGERGPDVIVTGDIAAVTGHPGCALLRVGAQTWLLTGSLADTLTDPAAAGRPPAPRRITVRGHAANAAGITTVCGPYPAFVVVTVVTTPTTHTT